MNLAADACRRLGAIFRRTTKSHSESWGPPAADFEWDGSLRDIYVLNTDPADWQNVMQAIRELYGPVEFIVDGEPAEMPHGVDGVFAMRKRATVTLRFWVGPNLLFCHFFDGDKIEFDLDPRTVDGMASFDELRNFIRMLGDLTAKTVVLTCENAVDSVILRYSPEDADVIWLAPDSLAG